MLTITIDKPTWDAAWSKARNTLQVKDSQARHDFGEQAWPVIDRMTRALEEVLEQTRKSLEAE